MRYMGSSSRLFLSEREKEIANDIQHQVIKENKTYSKFRELPIGYSSWSELYGDIAKKNPDIFNGETKVINFERIEMDSEDKNIIVKYTINTVDLTKKALHEMLYNLPDNGLIVQAQINLNYCKCHENKTVDFKPVIDLLELLKKFK